MYITRVDIQNIRSIKNLVWETDVANAAGWHVILGDNGAGKTTFVRSVALAILGGQYAQTMRQNWDSWIAQGTHYDKYHAREGSTVLRIALDDHQDLNRTDPDALHTDTIPGYPSALSFGALIQPGGYQHDGQREPSFVIDFPYLSDRSATELVRKKEFVGFCSSFGPYRRFTGGDPEEDATGASTYARQLSAFSAGRVFTESIRWLQREKLKSFEGDPTSKTLLDYWKKFINQSALLPYGTVFDDVTSSGVGFLDASGAKVIAEELGDGYGSILSLTFELLRQLSTAFGPDIFESHPDGKVIVKIPGVVQIDEVDAHLHPTWQKRVGFWLTEHFPVMQFIVTTHSPLICQAAEKGSIFSLPRPGTEENGRMLEGAERGRLIYGNILDAYGTEAFGSGIAARSDKSQEMMVRLSQLNRKEVHTGLNDEERSEQERLRGALPTKSSLF